MLTAHSRKRSFRVRAKESLRCLTIDTNASRNDPRMENTSITVDEGSGQLDTSGDRRNEKGPRGKRDLRGLTIDTKVVQDAYKLAAIGNAVDTKLTRKANNAESPKISEAMMNRNWRNHRRALEVSSSDMMEPLWSAPPEKSKFPDGILLKPQRDDEYEIIDYDRGLERAAYRCRRPEEVRPELIPFTVSESVSADLCLSAPATKTEFSEAEIGTEERSGKYNPSVFQPSTKSVVRLDEMAPIKRAGYEKILNWDEQHADLKGKKSRALRESSSLTVVSLASPVGWTSVEFPYAEIRAVKDDMKFETGLSGVEETIRNQLSALVEPQSAGLPPEYLRKEYEEIREERRKMIALANSAVGTRGRQGGNASGPTLSGTDGANDTGFNDLLGKLNKLCAPRIRAFTVNDKDDGYQPSNLRRSEAIVQQDPPHSPSTDSAISGVPSAGRKRSSTLNPEAVEFRCPLPEEKSSVTNKCDTSPSEAPKQATEPADPIRRLENRVAELEAQIAKQKPGQGQFGRHKWTKGYKMNQTPYGTGIYGPMVPANGTHHPKMNGGILSPIGYQATHAISPPQPQPGFAIGMGGLHASPVLAPTHCVLPQSSPPPFPINGMPAAPMNHYNAKQAIIPVPSPDDLAVAKPAVGTPLWVKSVFGPKPVSKPDRPFRPGDGIQATRQQEYEEYLEHLRVTDPAYALSCKQRQARRADRQRLATRPGNGSGERAVC
ncbi:hypothetical protein SAMD00023353_3800510 [Rosellinia necatrix]|uniref:Uncharacterized protein n=1 Tax=Rosellinia necatrix TaxID=77044 RepID=A0A1W2TMH5_ROSNE|nr:hypothetical protein SAMD00023353_3800510 [Rosellinia necatrix]